MGQGGHGNSYHIHGFYMHIFSRRSFRVGREPAARMQRGGAPQPSYQKATACIQIDAKDQQHAHLRRVSRCDDGVIAQQQGLLDSGSTRAALEDGFAEGGGGLHKTPAAPYGHMGETALAR